MFKAYNRRTKRCLLCEEYISLTKDLKAALLLNQCVYWMERTHDYDLFLKEEYEHNPHCNVSYRHGWFYKSYEAFNDECMLESSKSTISRILNSFIENGWLERRHRKSTSLDQTYEYRVNLTKLQADLLHLGYTLANYKIDLFLSKSAKQNEGVPSLDLKTVGSSDLIAPEQPSSPLETESPMFQNETCKLQDNTSEKPYFIEAPDFSDKSSMFQNRTSKFQNETSITQQNIAGNKDYSNKTPMFYNEPSMLQNETCKFQNETPYIDTKITKREITYKTLSPTSLPKSSNSIPKDSSKREREEMGLKMIKMFSRIVSQGQELLPHPERIRRLNDVLHSQLQGKLENWEKVCQNITCSKFLMGEAQTSDFKATLDWVITKDHALKIFEGNSYGIGDRNASRTPTEPTMEEREALLLEFKNSNKHPLWLQASQLLFKKVEFSIFKSFISVLDILDIHKDSIELLAPNHYVRDYINRNLFSIPIKQALEGTLGHEVRFVYVSVGSKPGVNVESKPKTTQEHTSTQSVYPDDLVPQAYFPPLENPYFKGTRVAETQESSPDPPPIPSDKLNSDNEHN